MSAHGAIVSNGAKPFLVCVVCVSLSCCSAEPQQDTADAAPSQDVGEAKDLYSRIDAHDTLVSPLCEGAAGATVSFLGTEGIVPPCAVAIAADNETLYVAGCDSDSLTVYHRDQQTGVIDHVQTVWDGEDGVVELSEPDAIWVVPDGSQLIVGSAYGLRLFEVDKDTGQLFPGSPLPLDCLPEGPVCSYGYSVSGSSVGDLVAARTYKKSHLFTRNVEDGSMELLAGISDEHLSQIAGDSFVSVSQALLSAEGHHLYVLGDDILPGYRNIARLLLEPSSGELTFVSRFRGIDSVVPEKWRVDEMRLASGGSTIYGFGYMDDFGFVSGIGLASNGTDLEMHSQATVSDALDGQVVHMHDLQISMDGSSIWVAVNHFPLPLCDEPHTADILRYSANGSILASDESPAILTNEEWEERGEAFGSYEKGGRLALAPSGAWLAVTLGVSDSVAVFGCLDKLAQ